MTLTVLAHCPDTDRFGIAIATYSLAVGGKCPFIARGLAVLSTQAYAEPALGPRALDQLAKGNTPASVMDHLSAEDPNFSYRQVAILDAQRRLAVHTGTNCRSWAGHETGDGWAAFGNVLSGGAVVTAMARVLQEGGGRDLADRLLEALEAGRDAGGQATADGTPLAERSAALIVRGAESDLARDLDLRVDAHHDAVTELRRVYQTYAPYMEYYALRARDPQNTPAPDVWERRKKSLSG